MKNYIFYLFVNFYKSELSDYLIKKFPLKQTKRLDHEKVILVKKGKIREWRMYDENHTRIYNFHIDSFNNVIINP